MAKHYDVIVAGAGPAGLMAAKTAGENGSTLGRNFFQIDTQDSSRKTGTCK